MMLLGAGFGLGVALTLSRLLNDLTPGLTIGPAPSRVRRSGFALTVWVVGSCVGCSATGLCSTDGPATPPRWCSPRSSRWWRRECWLPSRR